jgi:hypothetical protein
MAPYKTHFLVAERVWEELPGPWQPHFDQFCFGCVAPDVDKISTTLTQKDTHFYDRSTAWDLMASHRTAAFLKAQGEFLCCPFSELAPEAQAFALGYLCHLAVDEVSKYMWQRPTWLPFRATGPGPAFAALDEQAHGYIRDYSSIVNWLRELRVIHIIPIIPAQDMEAYLDGVRTFCQAADVVAEYAVLVDMFSQVPLPDRQEQLAAFKMNINEARQHVHIFQLDVMLETSIQHSRQQIEALLNGRTPEPRLPNIMTPDE